MQPVEIKPGIFWIGVNDRKTDLFEGLWSIRQEGISYNTYLVSDKKKAIIDLTKEMMTGEFLDNISGLIDLAELDYIVINHMEPDHSGALRTLRRLAPHAVILGTKRTQKMLEDFFAITDGVQVVSDGETLDLGKHTLRFISAPRVHWPETMFTYEVTQQVLFSCDAFGGYGAVEGGIFDDPHVDLAFYEQEALRYFANILTSFCKPLNKALENLKDVPVAMVAPSHGLIWRSNPRRIIDLYTTWAQKPAEKAVTLLYTTMYGNTEKMMHAVAHGISSQGLPLEVFNISETHISYILPSLWMRQGVAVGAPTYERHLFPYARHALDMAALKDITAKTAAYFGSYGWGGGAMDDFDALSAAMSWDVVGRLGFTGGPTLQDLKDGEALGVLLAQQVKAYAPPAPVAG